MELLIVGLRVHNILRISQILSQAAIAQGLDAKTAEFTNEPLMTTEVAHVRIGQCVESPLILEGNADLLICFEPLLALDLVVKYLVPKGTIIVNTKSLLPDINLSKEAIRLFCQLTEKVIKFDSVLMAKESRDISKSSFVMLGVLDALGILPVSSVNIKQAAEEVVSSGDLGVCLKAMEFGNKIALELSL